MEFNFEKEIKCICGAIYETKDFQNHFKECQQFKECFSSFDDKLSKLIKSYSEPKDQLLLIRFLFNQYIKILDKKIKGNYVEISKAFKESFMNSIQEQNLNSNYGSNFLNKTNKDKFDINYDKRFAYGDAQ